MKISIINGDGTTTYVENMTPVTSLEEFSDSLTSATQALNDSQTETNATFAGTSLTVPTDLMSIFEEAADTYGVDVNLLTAIAKQESNFTADATSSSGAMGIMQLMPATAQGLGVSDAYDPYQNIMGGAKYISQLLSRYDGDVSLALAAYNAGSLRKHRIMSKKCLVIIRMESTFRHRPAVHRQVLQIRKGCPQMKGRIFTGRCSV